MSFYLLDLVALVVLEVQEVLLYHIRHMIRLCHLKKNPNKTNE